MARNPGSKQRRTDKSIPQKRLGEGVEIEGLDTDSPLRRLVRTRMEAALERFHVSAGRARAAFLDEDGPKGGVSIRCSLTVEVPQHATVHAEHVAETHEFAFDGAAAALERNLGRDRERARELSRRPKKYFAAKRLLTPETPPSPSSANRARRRKSA